MRPVSSRWHAHAKDEHCGQARARVAVNRRQCLGLRRQGGAAILLAMLTVTLVATIAAAALWQQWRSLEVETAERTRAQAGWVLTGALDWSRLVLREDSRAGSNADHLAEPWAVALEEARLSSFLAADSSNQTNVDEVNDDAFLSGQMVDLQAQLNVSNLQTGGTVDPVTLAQFAKLFDLLNLPRQELDLMVSQLRLANATPTDAQTTEPIALMPTRVSELGWLGLSPSSVQALSPFITILPKPAATDKTPVNLNTASAEVLYACLPALDLAGARRLVSAREIKHFRSLEDVKALNAGLTNDLNSALHAVQSQFFEIRGQLRIGSVQINERSMVKRDGAVTFNAPIQVLWRQRQPTPPGQSLQ